MSCFSRGGGLPARAGRAAASDARASRTASSNVGTSWTLRASEKIQPRAVNVRIAKTLFVTTQLPIMVL
jgi:hypothetical protein